MSRTKNQNSAYPPASKKNGKCAEESTKLRIGREVSKKVELIYFAFESIAVRYRASGARRHRMNKKDRIYTLSIASILLIASTPSWALSVAECKAIIRGRDYECPSADCRAIVRGKDYECASADCRAIVRAKDYQCASADCRAIVRGKEYECASAACRAIVRKREYEC